MTLAKLRLDRRRAAASGTQRLPILLAVVVLASVGSHMPAKFRYYSVIYRQVLRCGSGPGAGSTPKPTTRPARAESSPRQ